MSIPILSTSKPCNRRDQLFRLLKGDECARNSLVFSAYRARSSYSRRTTGSAGHVGWDDENYRKVPGTTYGSTDHRAYNVRFITSAPPNVLASRYTILVLVLPILLIMYELEMTSFVFKSGSGIEFRFPVLDTHSPESDAKISLPSWASMI